MCLESFIAEVHDALLWHTSPQRGGGGGKGAIPSLLYTCQLRGQSRTLMMILPLPHYDNFATFFFSSEENCVVYSPRPPR